MLIISGYMTYISGYMSSISAYMTYISLYGFEYILALTTYLLSRLCTAGCYIPTTGGNADGASCVFPFVYRGNTYQECTTINNQNTLWCSITTFYDVDKRWGNCLGRKTYVYITLICIMFYLHIFYYQSW